MHFDTLAIHFAQEPDPTTGAVVTPIVQTSTFAQEAPGVHKGFEYTRTNNPTRKTLEDVLAVLEGGKAASVFASGLAAENAVLEAYVGPGDHVLTSSDVYGGTFRLLNVVYRKKGVSFTQVDLDDLDAVRAAFRPETKILWIESPTNPRLLIADIAKLCAIAKERGVLVVVDNTFASPVNQQPFKFGADIIVHSVTKYLAGHSDVIQGAVIARTAELLAPVKFLQNACGGVPSPFDCWLTLRGLKTLSLRVERHNRNAQAVAEFLSEHPLVKRAYYPGLPSHPNHDIAKAQMSGFGGVVSIEIDCDLEATKTFVSNLKYFKLAESLGGVKSLICHPATMTHASIPAVERRAKGLADGLVRISVGLEDVRDLIEDLGTGLAAIRRTPATGTFDAGEIARPVGTLK